MTNSDCPRSDTKSEICKLATGENVCADHSEVVYVDDDSTAPDVICGTVDAPCSSIQTGIDRATMGDPQKLYIKVAEGLYIEHLTIDLSLDQQLHILGAGKTDVRIVRNEIDRPIIVVSGAGTVSLDGVEVSQASGTGADGIQCTGEGILRVSRSFVRDNTGIGINTMGCDLTVEQSEIGTISNRNQAGGISINGGQFVLINNIIADNGSASSQFGGVQFTGTVREGSRIEFNTIVDNTKEIAGSNPAGVNCSHLVDPPGTIAVTASNNLVQGNSAAIPDQVGFFGCSWTFSVLGVEQPANNNLAGPCEFDTVTFRLLDSDSACIDAADPAATLTVDIDGNSRPSPAGGRRDIGAHEARP